MTTVPATKQTRADIRKPNGILSTSAMLKLSISKKIARKITNTPAIMERKLAISRTDSNKVVNKLHEQTVYKEKTHEC